LPEYGIGRMLQTARIAPLPVDDRIVGTVTIIEDVTQREMQAAILRRQQEYDRLLSEVLALLLEAADPVDTAAQLFPRLAVPLKLDVFFNYLYSPEDKMLRLTASGGLSPEARRAVGEVALGDGLCGQVAERRAPLIEFRVQHNHSPQVQDARRLGLCSYAGFPLLLGDRLLGTISFGSYERDTMPLEVVDVLGKIAQYLAISIDRSQRERELGDAQLRLSQHASELEQKITERTAKLHETITQLESFSYTVAHDLRAPIRSLTGYAEVLLADYRDELPEDGQRVVQRLHRASHRLDALTRDLLKFSRIVREEVSLTPLDVHEVVQDIVGLTPALQDGVLTIEPPLGHVLGQRTLLQQCLSNLFDNALKFAKPGTHPRLVVRGELRPEGVPASRAAPASLRALTPEIPPARGARWRIWIEDNGIGIATSAQDRIFGIFERIPGPLPVEGTGIGLAIVAHATEQMGGACGVESEAGKGSRFWIELAHASEG
jgi:signal transduction histidine kinase